MMKALYKSEVHKELLKYKNEEQDERITEKDISHLPRPVRTYFRYCGYLGQVKMKNAEIVWDEFNLRLAPNKPWMKVKSKQFNSVPEPARIAYMNSRMMGIVPFEGRDKYQDGHGNMRIKLLKWFQVADAKGTEMDESALVTLLAETLLVPSYALQPYMTWTSIDHYTAKAEIQHNDHNVSGIFTFNGQGEFIRFETNDRYYSEKGTEYKKLKWSVVASNYIDNNRMKYPSCIQAMWHLDQEVYLYFTGIIRSINYNITMIT
ncbi:DUF6544 family protein [Brevibacillus sp. SYSU BS000544]|uniref:DUF6544 family protein n=1 Tax=Brevibacillus sp. SYSU BS000544 TaxID=3416443 RepID=UPI003CE5ADBE